MDEVEESEVRGCCNITFICTPTRKQCLCSKSFNTLDNWGHKTPTQSKKEKDRKEKIKGSWPGTCIKWTDHIVSKKN